MPSPTILAVVQHGSLVLLAFTDDNGAVEVARSRGGSASRPRRHRPRGSYRLRPPRGLDAMAAASVARTSSIARLRSAVVVVRQS